MGARTGQGLFIYNKYLEDGVTLSSKSIHQEGQWVNGKFIKPENPPPAHISTPTEDSQETPPLAAPSSESSDITLPMPPHELNAVDSTKLTLESTKSDQPADDNEDKENVLSSKNTLLPPPSPASAIKASGIPKLAKLTHTAALRILSEKDDVPNRFAKSATSPRRLSA